LVGGLLGLVAGFAGGIFVYPYIFLRDIVAEEQVVDRANKWVVATGEFIHVNRSDPIGGARLRPGSPWDPQR